MTARIDQAKRQAKAAGCAVRIRVGGITIGVVLADGTFHHVGV